MQTVEELLRDPGAHAGDELSHAVDVALRELAMEKVRREKYPQYPSRMAALYVSRTYREAEQWGDYFAESEEQEQELFRNLKQLKQEQGLPDDEFFHYDTPLTVEHESAALQRAGFSEVRAMKNWGHTFTLLAVR